MVSLPRTPSYDWAWMVGFLQARIIAGVERSDEGGYNRSFGIEGHHGLVHLTPDEEAQGLRMTLSPGLQPTAEICYTRTDQLFDLVCDPRQVAETLGSLAQARPGLRLPGALDAFEQVMRAVLGQLVSVAMAAQFTAKVAVGQGGPLVEVPDYVLLPMPEALSWADPQTLKVLGMSLRRAEMLIYLARMTLSDELPLTAPMDIDAGLRQLQNLPGINHQTASYFVLRGWRAKDILLPGNYLIRQHFPGVTPAVVARYVRHWQPARSYTLLHIRYTDDWIPATEQPSEAHTIGIGTLKSL